VPWRWKISRKRDCAVLAERDRLARAGETIEERQRSAAQIPEGVAGRRVERGDRRDQANGRSEPPLEFMDPERHIRGVIRAELDHQQRFGSPADGGHRLLQASLLAGEFDEHPVHQFHGGRPELEAEGKRI
jgi:hypothetical protein